jgi:hypothetical protein
MNWFLGAEFTAEYLDRLVRDDLENQLVTPSGGGFGGGYLIDVHITLRSASSLEDY